MPAPDTGERRADFKAKLLERLHDPLQLRIFVIGTVLLLGYSLVYSPLTSKIKNAKHSLNQQQKLATLAETLEKLQAQRSKYSKRLPGQTDSKEWIQYMHEGVRGFPVKLTRLDCLSPKQLGPYKVMVLSMELEGTLYDLDNFLRWIESNPRLLRADEINISVAQSKKLGGKQKKEEQEENKDDMVMQLTVLALAG